jgi:hypothetical protein
MTQRLNAPAPIKAWLDYSQTTQKNGHEDSLMDLVKIRASQIKAAPSASTCIRPKRAGGGRRSSVST